MREITNLRRVMAALRTRRVGVALLCGITVVGALWWFQFLREPRYQGVVLSSWLREFDHAWDTSIFPCFDNIPTQAVCAVREIGGSAVPTLLTMLRKETSPTTVRLNELLEKQSLLDWRFANSSKSWGIAVLGFQVLGERGAGAVPELKRMLEDSRTAERAVIVLGGIGRPALPTLCATLAHTNASIRGAALLSLANVIPPASEALSASMLLAADSDPTVRKRAVLVLGMFTNDLERTAAVLRGKLKDSDPGVRNAAIRTLGRGGERGQMFMPDLMAVLQAPGTPMEFATTLDVLRQLDAPPSLVVQPLIEALQAPDTRLHGQAARTLAIYGSRASNASPALVDLIESSPPGHARDILENSLARIDPAAAMRLGIDTNLAASRPSRRR